MSAKGESGFSSREEAVTEEGYNERRVDRTLASLMGKIVSLDHEVGYAISLDGEVLSTSDSNKEHSVEITNAKNAITLHNHPNGGTFSPDDVWLSQKNNEYLSYVIEGQYKFTLKKMDWKKWVGGKLTVNTFARDYEKYMKSTEAQIISNANALRSRGTIKNDEEYKQYCLEQLHHKADRWLRNHSEDYGYDYSRHRA